MYCSDRVYVLRYYSNLKCVSLPSSLLIENQIIFNIYIKYFKEIELYKYRGYNSRLLS